MKYCRILIGSLLLFQAVSFRAGARAFAATFFGEVPKGLVELKDYNNPVYVFIPPGQDKSLLNSMILIVPDPKEAPDDLVNEWLSIAKKKNLIVAVPVMQMERDSVPFRTDEWLLKVKKDLTDRYHVGKAYLIGKGEGAQYAAYLAVQYPEQFSGAGLLDGSWVGPFEKVMRLSSRPARQVPFFISLFGPDAELMKQTEDRAYRYTARGYLVYLEKFEKNEKVDSLDLKARMIDWLQKKAESWEQVMAQSGKTKKEKISKWLGEFISSPVHS